MNDSTDSLSRNPVGKITLSYFENHDADAFVINIPEVDNSKFFNIAQTIAVQMESGRNMTSPELAIKADSDKFRPKQYATINVAEDRAGQHGSHEKPNAQPDDKEGLMSDFNRSELQAHLRSNKAEVDAVAAIMKKDMAEWREQMRADLRDVKDAINSQNNSLDQHIIAQKTQLDAHIQLQKMLIEKEFSTQAIKIDTSIKLQTAGLQESLSAVKLDVTRWVVGLILGVPSILFTIFKIFEAVSAHS